MFVVSAEFKFGGSPTEPRREAVNSVLCTWRENGQILGTAWPLVATKNSLTAFVTLPEETSLASERANSMVTKATESLDRTGARLTTTLIGPEADLELACSCKTRTWQLLLTTYLDASSPLKCGDCLRSVPLYRIPLMRGGYYWDILAWQADYRATDHLQMGGCGEKWAEEQLVGLSSDLTVVGRRLRGEIENLTGIPTYYHLLCAVSPNAETESRRKCPSCEGEWRLGSALHDQIDYRCESCRLTSNAADSFADG